MPGLNFDYTKFLREQHEKYIKKYGDEPIKSTPNPDPINGYGGHVPYYRNSLHELQVVRSLVRCVSSPMKPTTATGYKSKSSRFYRPEDEDTLSQQGSNKSEHPKTPKSPTSSNRVRSAPAAISREGRPQDNRQPSPHPSHISMLASGSSDMLKKESLRPRTAYSATRSKAKQEVKLDRETPKSSSRLSDISVPPIKQPVIIASKHPEGYPQTLYGASYWYAWPNDRPQTKESSRERPNSFAQDRRLTRKDGVIYHRHEGMVPKYLGYVPSYKFRHGSTFGVLTVNATHYSVANKLAAKAK
ncbi:uncharacterized protein LOC120346801 [Styela clava]